MSSFHRINVLRIKQCSDSMRWYRNMVGQHVPHLGWNATDGFSSRERAGHLNFILTQDAEPTHVHVRTEDLAFWPYGSSDRSARLFKVPRHHEPATPPKVATPGPLPGGQSRRLSAIESVTSLVVGFVVSVLLGFWVFPSVGHELTLNENLFVTFCYSIASLIRTYGLRRFFNWVHTWLGVGK